MRREEPDAIDRRDARILGQRTVRVSGGVERRRRDLARLRTLHQDARSEVKGKERRGSAANYWFSDRLGAYLARTSRTLVALSGRRA